MPTNLPLAGKTIILTGSKKVTSILPYIEESGARALAYPLIAIQEIITVEDERRLAACNDYDWLIFTSQNAVQAFIGKMKRAGMKASAIQCQIAVVGEKTALALREHGFRIDFMPSVYSADYFVQQFNGQGRVLFLRGSLAKETITVGIGADEWTVYETVPNVRNVQQLDEAIVTAEEPIVVFASPSAVHVYAEHIASKLGWQAAKYATIGHVTTEALATYGMEPIVQPETYTMQAVIKQIISEVSTQ